MLHLTLRRKPSTFDGTFGTITLPTGLQLLTGELPWRDNVSKSSCIPVGTYVCKSLTSPKFGKCYTICNVPNRSNILFHAANYCGLSSESKKQELQGCIALGLGFAKVNNQKIITSSRLALKQFHSALNWQPFTLTIL